MQESYKYCGATITLARKGAAWTWEVRFPYGGSVKGFRPNYELAVDAAEDTILINNESRAAQVERNFGC